MTAYDRIMAQVTPEPNTGCWLWTGYLGRNGYPLIGSKTPTGYRPVRANRVMLQIATGDIGSGLEACHRCHEKACVNPAHLYWGTRSRNMQDSAMRGTVRTQKIRAEQAIEIARRHRAGESAVSIARCFGVSPQTVSNIAHGYSWGHVTGIARAA